MPCFSPLQALRLGVKPNGKANIKIFKTRFKNYSIVHPDVDLLIPCGQCVGCRLERSRQWAARCVHEASLHNNNCFITLTFDEDHLLSREHPFSLEVRDFQLFMKRLRKKFGNGIRFYQCGEYGDRYGRPHYHACIFNFDFPDRVLWKQSNGIPLYTSESLSKLWPFGYSSVGDVTFESAAYVARYIMKKLSGFKAAEVHDVFDSVTETVYSKTFYEYVDFLTGETYMRRPEYTTMSRRPGIASGWFDKWAMVDTYPNDFVVLRGRKMLPPKFYDSKLPEDMLKELKANRIAKALEFVEDQSPGRLIVREKCAAAKLRLFGRNVE